MKLSELLNRLNEIQNRLDVDPNVRVMTESRTLDLQLEDIVTDIAYSNRLGIIIIGHEED